MSGLDIAVIGGALLAYALLSRRLVAMSIPAPMVFVTRRNPNGPIRDRVVSGTQSYLCLAANSMVGERE